MGLEHRPLMVDHMVSISRNEASGIDLREENKDLVLCRVAYESVKEQLAGQEIDLSHCTIMEAASTQINMVEEGNGRGVISELMLSTIPNELVRGSVHPKMDIEISLVANDFDDLPAAAREISSMILERKL